MNRLLLAVVASCLFQTFCIAFPAPKAIGQLTEKDKILGIWETARDADGNSATFEFTERGFLILSTLEGDSAYGKYKIDGKLIEATFEMPSRMKGPQIVWFRSFTIESLSESELTVVDSDNGKVRVRFLKKNKH